MQIKQLSPSGFQAAPTVKTYHCGTLTYTRAGLFALFTWLLWGDFCYTLMEAVVPSILPLKLKDLGSPNWFIGMIMATLPGILNMTICPWVSFKSDRYRSKWGRRIPFIICTLPFLCICLAMLGFSDEITGFLQRHSGLREYAPTSVTLGLIAIFMVMFQFFNMFVASVFCFLFNDVVPAQFMGRFIGTFRIVGTGAGALYNFFIFKYANTHMHEIFLGATLLYFVGIGMMCLMVKEGQYPPLEGETGKSNKGWGGIKTFLKESFTHKFYWMRFLSTAFSATAGAIGAFTIFFYQNMGLDLDHVGKITATSSVAVIAATYFMAIYIDRWHPLRICVYSAVFGVIGLAINMVWIFVTLPGSYFFWLNIGNVVISSFWAALAGVAAFPAEMRIFPQSRFGQFCSAQALIRSAFTIFAGMAAGLFIDFFKWTFNGSDFAYRFIYLWLTVFAGISAFFLVLVYIQWNRMGGDKHFHPPASWNPEGVEELPLVPTIGPQTKWLKISFLLFDGVMSLPVLSIPFLMLWMFSHKEMFAFKWYGLAVLPLSLLALAAWWILKRSIYADMAAARDKKPLRNGLPHHGVLIVIGSNFLLAIGIWICQVFSALYLNLENGAITFGIANGITNFLIIGALYLICRIERGFSTAIDEVPEVVQ